MKFWRLSSKVFKAVMVFSILVALGILINWGEKTTDEAIIASSTDEMAQIVEQITTLVEAQLDIGLSQLKIIATVVAEQGVDAFHNLSEAQVGHIDNLHLITPTGAGYSHSGAETDFSQDLAFKGALSAEYFVSNPTVYTENQQIGFDIALPVERDGEIIAVMFCHIVVEQFFEATTLDGQFTGNIFIVDDWLNLHYSTSPNHVGSQNIPGADVDEMGMSNVAQAQQDILAGKSGGFSYDYFGNLKVMAYNPIDMTELTLAINLEVASLNNELIIAAEQFSFISRVVYWVVISLVLYITISQRRAQKALEKTAYYDMLTGLPNTERLKVDMKAALTRNKEKQYTILLYDIENFKAINEMFGYSVGDRVLKAVATLRDSFEDPDLITARVAGDRFAFFAPRPTLDDLMDLSVRIDNHYNEVVPELIDYNGTFKVGIYNIELGETDVDDILTKVNLAMATAKASKGMPFCEYDDAFKDALKKEAEITSKMKSAIDNKEFVPYLQPKFSIEDERIIGAEALVRWIEPSGTMIFPNDFIPLFERNGFIVELDKYMLEQACATIRRWIDEGLGAVPVSVNCSRLNLQNPYFAEGIAAIADKYNIPHEYIEIELTESATIQSDGSIDKLFLDLRNSGFKISIDDFGSGYSSLGMLKTLNVDTLKMDRTFFVGGSSARRDDMLVDGIVRLSHNLGMYVVAEGIETQEQVNLLRQLNCDAVQGYFFARPMPVADFERDFGDKMPQRLAQSGKILPLIGPINDTRYANSIVPCGIQILEMDATLTVVEANDGYFDLVGYTRQEVRELFANSGAAMIHKEDMKKIREYFVKEMQSNADEPFDFVARLRHKQQEYIAIQIVGKTAINEHGVKRLYCALTDVSAHAESLHQLQGERDFNSLIAELTGNAFFDYDVASGAIRFSKNFADRFAIPEVVEDFLSSDIGRSMFAVCKDFLGDIEKPLKRDGVLTLEEQNGGSAWFLFDCETIYDEARQGYRSIGKMTEVTGHKLEIDMLRAKSETDHVTNVFNALATERFIKNYLKLAMPDNDMGALFVIDLDNFSTINEVFGREFGDQCLKEIGIVLRNMFRSTDIIGRASADRFFVFIGDYKTIDFVNKKAAELCESLERKYQHGRSNLHITVSVGVSIYPEHGEDFSSLYEMADTACKKVKMQGKNGFALCPIE